MKPFFRMILIILATALPFTLAAQTEGQQFRIDSKCQGDSINFTIVNIGENIQEGGWIYYLIEDGEIKKEEKIPRLENMESMQLTFHPKGLDVSLEILDPLQKRKRVEGVIVTNCGTVYPLMSRLLKGKPNQLITGKHNHPWAIGIYAGTLGPGVTISKNMGAAVTMRVGGTYLPLKFTLDEFIPESITNIDIQFFTLDLKLDYYVSKNPKNPFHLTFGAVYNKSYIRTFTFPQLTQEIKIGNQVIAQDDLGTVDFKVQPNKINPFFGLGLGRLANYKKRVGMKLEIGSLFTGSPKVSLEATDSIAATSSQAEQLQRNLRQYYIYPVINFYLSVKL